MTIRINLGNPVQVYRPSRADNNAAGMPVPHPTPPPSVQTPKEPRETGNPIPLSQVAKPAISPKLAVKVYQKVQFLDLPPLGENFDRKA